MDTTTNERAINIINAAVNLDKLDAPPCCWGDEDEQPDGHWSGTLGEMKEELGRELSDLEITCLSLTRNWGPTPALDDEEAVLVLEHLWPEGNAVGSWMDWIEMGEKMAELVISSDIARDDAGKYRVVDDYFGGEFPPISRAQAQVSADRANSSLTATVAEFFNL